MEISGELKEFLPFILERDGVCELWKLLSLWSLLPWTRSAAADVRRNLEVNFLNSLEIKEEIMHQIEHLDI